MRIALIAEHFVPMRSSCAVQMRDLARELTANGHDVTVLVPSSDQAEPWRLEEFEGIDVVRLKAMATRDRSYVVRTVGEFAMPFAMLRNYRKSPVAGRKYDGIAWYSPNIFLGPLVAALKKQSEAPAYLILRDIFPQWAADLGLMRRGPVYHALDRVARYQYSVANVIGVQTPANTAFFEEPRYAGKRVEVLQNWLQPPVPGACSIDLAREGFADRNVFVYAGNMGIAQGAGRLLDFAIAMRDDDRAAFVFVGRGSDVAAMREKAARETLTNVRFYDEIDPDEIPSLYAQCAVGMVALDARHKTHNIPGKFISYMHAGLPVLACVNAGNDLVRLIRQEDVGRVSTDVDGGDLPALARQLLDAEDLNAMGARALNVADTMFSAKQAARQIAQAFA